MNGGNDMVFPVLDRAATPNDTLQLGLTKREYFAVHLDQPGMAEIVTAAGLTWSNNEVWEGEHISLGYFDKWWSTLPQARRFALYAKVRVALADALLAELASPSEGGKS
jgi:hypothetical protein